MTVERVYAPAAYEYHRPQFDDGKCALCDARTNRIHRRLPIGSTESHHYGEAFVILIGSEERAYINSAAERAQVPPPSVLDQVVAALDEYACWNLDPAPEGSKAARLALVSLRGGDGRPGTDAHPLVRGPMVKLMHMFQSWRERASQLCQRGLRNTTSQQATAQQTAATLNECAEELERLLLNEAFDLVAEEKLQVTPIPIILTCIACGARHIDEGEFATKPHESHACQKCGVVWKPAKVPTVGVQFLPGYRNEPST